MLVDFHCHSTASDGSVAPQDFATLTRGFKAVALTDHDGLDGISGFAVADGCRPFAGLELSIEPGAGFDTFHLLGLGVDARHPQLRALCERAAAGRDERNRQMLENFHRIGIPMDDLIAVHGARLLARPHFAEWLVVHGHAADIADAFARYLTADSPLATRCYESRWQPAREAAFAAIHAAGGLAMMAHPRYWRREWKHAGCDFAAAKRGLAELKAMGLDGIEAVYQANTNGETIEFIRIADQLNLLKSAGSDFHGTFKPTVKLGMEVSPDYIAPLLERLEVKGRQ